MRELNDDANAAMGTLLALFYSDCNSHRELSSWFEEDVTAALPQHDRGRKDYNLCNAWLKFNARYQPNKQVNLDTILKKWEAFTDEDFSFADYHGKHMKLIDEMELIGQPPAEAKRYEMLRRNVKNPSLEHIVAKPSLPDARRISLDIFFEDCNYFIQYNKKKDSGRKRKAEEVLGRVVTMSKDSTSDLPPNTVCYRWGRPGHLNSNFNSKLNKVYSLRY